MPFTMVSVVEKKNYDSDSRVQSPRPNTPEPSSRQGRRNTHPSAWQLLDDDSAISEKVVLLLWLALSCCYLISASLNFACVRQDQGSTI